MHSETNNNISFLEQAAIDPEKWDQCISGSINGLIYGQSFYLDHMAKNWAALVLNDYEAVMPLPWNRKYGIRYLYQPAFTAQLGLFSPLPSSGSLIQSFLSRCEKHFRFCELPLNGANCLSGLPLRTNYILDLQKNHGQIRTGYRKDLIQNLKTAGSDNLSYTGATEHQPVIDLYKNLYGNRFPQVKTSDYQHFSDLCEDLSRRKMIIVRQVTEKNSGRLLASAIFFKDGKRLYNIMSVTLPDGREKLANPYLLDQLIREFSGGKTTLDFEGSQIPGIAEFYRKFGAVSEPYPFFRFNHLPFPFRLLK
ncbi:MAG: hypothetical protein ACHQD7_04685 [Chitinophagales bacterium]